MKVDSSRLNKKKGVYVGGPESILKVLKPNVGRLGLTQNRGV